MMVLRDHSPVVPIWKVLWWISAHLKVKTFMWFLIKQCFPLRDRILRLQMISPDQNICPLCGNVKETFSHLFLHYNFVSVLWHQVIDVWDVPLVCLESFPSFFEIWFYMDLAAHNILPW